MMTARSEIVSARLAIVARGEPSELVPVVVQLAVESLGIGVCSSLCVPLPVEWSFATAPSQTLHQIEPVMQILIAKISKPTAAQHSTS